MAAVKPEADKDNPKEQHRHDDVIRCRQPGRKTDAAENDRKQRRRAAERCQYCSDRASGDEGAVGHPGSALERGGVTHIGGRAD